jgi:deoxyribonucleoside regulator
MSPRTLETDGALLTVRAAELYYEQDKTQDEIGQILGITRWKVGRLLHQAKEQGIIRIEIVHPKARRVSMERELVEKFGLVAAIVVPSEDDATLLRERVAVAAADYLVSMRPRTKILGVSWGKTLHDVASALPSGWSAPVQVVQINGGVSHSASPALAAATATMIAQKSGGEVMLMPTPAILERVDTKLAIESDRAVSAVLDKAHSADTYLFSAGPATRVSIHLESGYISGGDIDRLQELGAVGDVLGRYITSGGTIADTELNQRTLGLSLDTLRGSSRSIAVVAGADKHRVAQAIAANKLANVLITDEDTARFLLGQPAAEVSR